MTENKIVELLKGIEQKGTSLGWESTSVNDRYQATLSNYIISVQRTYQGPEPDFSISILDKDGNELETLSDAEINVMIKSLQIPNLNAFNLMHNIFTDAKRKALGVDKAIDDI